MDEFWRNWWLLSEILWHAQLFSKYHFFLLFNFNVDCGLLILYQDAVQNNSDLMPYTVHIQAFGKKWSPADW